MKTICKLIAALLLMVCSIEAATVKVNTRNFTSEPTMRRRTTLTLIDGGPVVAAPWLIAGDQISAFTDTNGVAYYSNVLAGAYRLDISGTPGRSFPISVYDTTNVLDAASLVNTTNANAAFYTATQIDALLSELPAGGGGPLPDNVITNNQSTPVVIESTLTVNQIIGDGSLLTGIVASSTNGGPALAALSTNQIWVSAIYGSDTTGTPNAPEKPFLTVGAAQERAASGDTIRVGRGQYIENGLGADGVIYELATDALVGDLTLDGPIFNANNISIRIGGRGFIYSTNYAVRTSGIGSVSFDGVTIAPNTTTNTVYGTWFTP